MIRSFKKLVLMTAALFMLTSAAMAAPSCNGKRILAYYPDWQSYKQDKIPYSKLTHICHAFTEPNTSGVLNGPTIETNLITNAHANGVKVLISVGGAAVPASTFSTLMNNTTARNNLVNNLYNFCATYNYDGVDMDWEYPGNTTDEGNYNTFMAALRNRFNTSPSPAPTWLITSAIPGGYGIDYFDFPTLNNYVDFWNVMTYDMHGGWSGHAGHNSSINRGSDPDAGLNCVSYINNIIAAGIPAAKINLGVPFYGYNFPTAEDLNGGCSGGCGGAYQMAYSDIAPLIGNGWTYYNDAASQVPYLRNNAGAGFISYDDPASIAAKVDYAMSTRGLGGVFMWEITQDYTAGNQPLMDSMYNRFMTYCPSGPTYTPTQTPTTTYYPIAGTIQCEDYAAGAEGVAYHDTTAGNSGGVYRSDGVDVETCMDIGGGYNLGYTVAGEWLNYNVNVTAAGTYDVSVRVASQGAGGTFHIEMNSVNITGTMTVPDTTAWQTWTTLVVTGINLTAGTKTMRLVMDANGASGGIGNFNYVSFALAITPTPTRTFSATATRTNTFTNTPTNTFTRTNTPTNTGTQTNTATSTRTQTPTDTFTNTPTLTRTFTATDTFTNTPTNSATNTRTFTPTNTATTTRTATNTWTLTYTPTETVTGTQPATWTYTDTPTDTPSETVTKTPTDTSTETHTLTPTFTFTHTASFTPTVTYTGTILPPITGTFTPTWTPTNTATMTFTNTQTATLTFTWTHTNTFTVTSTQTVSTPTPTATATLSASTGEPKIVLSYPNPAKTKTTLRCIVSEDNSELEFCLYTVDFRKVMKEARLAASKGEQDFTIVLPPGIANGVYFITYQQKGKKRDVIEIIVLN